MNPLQTEIMIRSFKLRDQRINRLSEELRRATVRAITLNQELQEERAENTRLREQLQTSRRDAHDLQLEVRYLKGQLRHEEK
jgi:chromosome segregation ATPase